MPSTLVDILTSLKDSEEGYVAFVESSNEIDYLSYSALYSKALLRLGALQSQGILPCHEVILQVENNLDFVITFWACILGGIIPVPLSVGQTDEHKYKIIEVSKRLKNPRLVISEKAFNTLNQFFGDDPSTFSGLKTTAVFIEQIRSFTKSGKLHPIQSRDIAFIQFSSGSTSHPKGVTLTHANLICNMRDIAYGGRYTKKEKLLSWMPLTHDMGLIGFHLNPMLCGMSHWIINTNLFIRRPRIWMDLASEHRIEVLCSPNFGYHYLLKHFPQDDPSWDLSSVRIIYNGAEPISIQVCDAFVEKLNVFGLRSTAICPVYGLAEASLAVTMTQVDQTPDALSLQSTPGIGEPVQLTSEDSKGSCFVNVGRPVASTTVTIADDQGVRLPEKVVGHVLIKGQNVSEGYYNDAEVTNSTIDQEWLKTGDLGFVLGSDLYITGRSKDIIFVNGLNYYPHDLERMAQELVEIDLNKIIICACESSAHKDQGLNEINAFVFFRGKIDRFSELARQLKQHLFQKTGILLDKVLPTKNIPRTTSGKLQRFKIRKEYENGAFSRIEEALGVIETTESTTLRTNWSDNQQAIVRLIEQACDISVRTLTSSFFDLGLTSLNAQRFLAQLSEERGIQIPIADLYKFPSLKALIDAIDLGKFVQYQPIPKIKTRGPFALSTAQERIYSAWQLNKESCAYNLPFALKLEGQLDQEKLQSAIHSTLNAIPVLYYQFKIKKIPLIHVVEQPRYEFRTEQQDIDIPLNQQLSSRVQPFDLEFGPLARVCLLMGVAEQHVLFLDFHHIIFDGISMSVLVEQLVSAYQGNKTPTHKIRYQDYILWQESQREKGLLNPSKEFWKIQLAIELPALRLPTDHARRASSTYKGGRVSFDIDASLTHDLKQIAKSYGCSTHVLMLGIYALLIEKYTNQTTCIVGIPVSGRNHPNLHQSLGMFVNNLPIILSYTKSKTFRDWIESVKVVVDESFAHQEYPFSSMVSDLQGKAKLGSGNLIFDTMFNYQNMTLPGKLDQDCTLARLAFDPGFSKYDLSLEIFEEDMTFSGAFEYSSDLFRVETISTLSEQFSHLIQEVVHHPEKQLVDFSLQSEKARNQLLLQFNDSYQEFASKTVVELFLDQAEKRSEAIAIRSAGETCTYQELRELSEKVASKLIALGMEAGDRVIIYGDRSIAAIASMLGALRVGVIYVPIDKNESATKIIDICQDCQPKAVLTTQVLSGQFPKNEQGTHSQIISIETLQEVGTLKEIPTQAAYMIYTSGSTGKPKGVVVGNNAFSNYIQWAAQHYTLSQKTFACFTSLSFDLTVTSIFTPLVAGGIIALFNEQDQISQIEKIFEDDQVDAIKLTPSHLKLLRNHPSIDLPKKSRTLIVGGEAFNAELAVDIDEMFSSGVRIFNEYGPTEATVGCMCYEFDSSGSSDLFMSLGQPIANTAIYLLNDQLEPVADNLIGEIYIGGQCLANEYFDNALLTAEKFIESPFLPGTRLYQTGDLARRTSMGTTYLGRSDNQMKINGHRVEAGEIESKICGLADVTDVAVIFNDDTLVGYLVGGEAIVFEKNLIIRELSKQLPAHMIPRVYFQIEQLPLARSGKTDYKALESIGGLEITQEVLGNEVTSEREALMLGFWQEVLKEERISKNDNFFELGGDSIKAVQLSSLLFSAGIQVQAQEILIHQTIADLIQNGNMEIVDQRQANREVFGNKEHIPIDRWFFAQQFANPEHYHQYITLEFKREVEPDVLEQCFQRLISNHDGLRMQVSGQELVILSEQDAPNFVLDVAKAENESDFGSITRLLNHAIRFENGLLIRAAFLDLESGSRLFITCHHLLVDGISWRVILDDLVKMLDQANNGEQVQLPVKSSSVLDWAKSINETEFPQESSLYWQNVTEKQRDFVIPVDIEHTSHPYQEAKKQLFKLDQEWTDALLTAQKESWIDPLNTLSTALLFALRDFSGVDDFVIDFENHGRHLEHVNVSRTTGWFTVMYPVHLRLFSDQIIEVIKSVKEQLDRVPDKGLSYNFDSDFASFSEVRFNFLGDFDQSFDSPWFSYCEKNSGAWIGDDNQLTAKLDLNVWIARGQLQLEITYHQPSFLEESVAGFGQNFMDYLKNILTELKGEVHFTTSDFDAIEMDDDLMESLF